MAKTASRLEKFRYQFNHQPKQLLWLGAVAGLMFTFLGLLSLVLGGSGHGIWQTIRELLIVGLAFAWAITSITKLRAQKGSN
jgi:formate/nitrite transporter FocA (FNT family)